MSTVLAIYADEPTFPATDQNPDAIRYHVGSWWVDALSGEPTTDEIAAILTPPAPSHLNNGGLVRFSGAAPVVVYENIRLGAVTRISKGRWRTALISAIPEGYSPIVGYIDAAIRNVRVSACTSTYVEVKATDAAGVAADCQQIIVKIERVVT